MYKTSVVITTFNRPQGLSEAVRSVLDQSRRADEIIIVNDGLRNQVLADIENHPLVSVVHNKTPKGANFARNTGVKAARYDIVMFLDDDDSWEREKIKAQLDAFHTMPEAGLVYTGKLVVNSSDRSKVLYKISADFHGTGMPDILTKNFI